MRSQGLDTAGSRTYSLQTKGEPISQVGGASENILNKRKNIICRGGSVRELQYKHGQRRRCSDAKAEIPLQPIEGTMVEQVLPCSPWKGCHIRAVGHLLKEAVAHRGPMME